MSPSVCLASLIILIARGQGIFIDPIEQAIKDHKSRPIGFVQDEE